MPISFFRRPCSSLWRRTGPAHSTRVLRPPGLTQLQAMSSRFAPTPLRVDTSKLSAGDRQALVKLIEAGRVMMTFFCTQYWSGNHALYAKSAKGRDPARQSAPHYFWLNKGPWSDLDGSCRVHARRARPKTAGRQFLSRRHDDGGIRRPGRRRCRRQTASRPKASSR